MITVSTVQPLVPVAVASADDGPGTVTVTSWEADTRSDVASYDVSMTAVGLAANDGPCSTSWCYGRFEGGRADPNGDISVVASLPGLDSGSSMSPGTST